VRRLPRLNTIVKGLHLFRRSVVVYCPVGGDYRAGTGGQVGLGEPYTAFNVVHATTAGLASTEYNQFTVERLLSDVVGV